MSGKGMILGLTMQATSEWQGEVKCKAANKRDQRGGKARSGGGNFQRGGNESELSRWTENGIKHVGREKESVGQEKLPWRSRQSRA